MKSLNKGKYLEKIKVIYIYGTGHNGSTLLNLLLNAHPDIVGVSEIINLDKHLKNNIDNLNENHKWNQIINKYEKHMGESIYNINIRNKTFITRKAIKNISKEKIEQYGLENYNLFKSILEVSGKKIIADSSKDHHRLYLLEKSGMFDIKVINLCRDGKAILNSYYKKYQKFKIGYVKLLIWRYYSTILKKMFKKSNWLDLQYEELASEPKNALQKIFKFIFDIEKTNEKTLNYIIDNYKVESYLGIGGNRMRYNKEKGIFFDQKWKKELSAKNKLLYYLTGLFIIGKRKNEK